ncbi:TIGR02677 family protein [Saccharopolyspora sp. NPDC000995]
MFVFTTTERADLHTAALYAFGEANERLETALTFDDVHTRLRSVGWFEPVSDEELDATLSRLRQWGLVDVVQNHAAHYTTAEDYERKNLQYLLTKRGEAAFEGVQHALTVLASSGALQTAVLDAIAERLGELHSLMTAPASSDRRIYTTLMELEGHLDALRTNTKQFNGDLQRLLRADQPDMATFQEVKSATVGYLQEFVTNLDQRRHTIREAVGLVEALGVDALHQRAVLGADLPKLNASDPAAEWLRHRIAKWAGLRGWFRPVDGASPRVDELQDIARRAIVQLLRALDRMSDVRRRSTSAAADFRALARWFAASGSEDEAHRLFNAAFGMWPARHAHLAHEDGELISSSESWAQAPPVPISPLLRNSGRTERIARTGKVRDVDEVRRLRREQARQERAELEAAWQQLATPGPMRLSGIGELDHDSFHRLLELIGRALAAREDSTDLRRAMTSDGRVEILLRSPHDGATATVRTPRGVFNGPDFVIDIRTTGSRSWAEEAQ